MPKHLFGRNSFAFTLIEILLAIAIFMMVVAAIYATWTLILRATQISKETAAQMQRERIAIRMIEDSLTSIQSFQASQQYYSFEVQNGEAPMLAYTARVPDDFPRASRYNPFNIRRLIFTVEAVSDPVRHTTENDLVLRQYPILEGMDPEEQANPFVLARNVQKFYVECLGTNDSGLVDWTDTWLDTNSIPTLVRISLVMNGNNLSSGAQAPQLSVTRTLAVPSQMMPSAIQTPSRGGGGGGGGNGNNNSGGVNIPPGVKLPNGGGGK